MNSRLLFVLVFAFLLIPITSFAYTTNNIPLDSRNHYGEVLVKNVKVLEKEFYKVIVLDIQIKVKDLELERSAWIEPDSIKLVNENGKVYFPKSK